MIPDTNKRQRNQAEKKGDRLMDKIQRLKQEKQYEEYVKQKTPQHNVWLNMLKAFLLGHHLFHRTGHQSLLRAEEAEL